jgi:hypothetical protein
VGVCWFGFGIFKDVLKQHGLLTALGATLAGFLDAIVLYYPLSLVLFPLVFATGLAMPGLRSSLAVASLAIAGVIATIALRLYFPFTIGPCSVRDAYSPSVALLPVTLGLCMGSACRIWQLRSGRPRGERWSLGLLFASAIALLLTWDPRIDLFAGG